MTTTESILWNRIQQFRFDDPDTSFTFSERLARENGWTKTYTQRVIEEYKKFIFLCCVSDTGVTPSDPVDQAWHLHLTFTKSYWTDLCKNTLEKEIHHNPTKGGQNEAAKFDDFYSGTKAVYISLFQEEPPADIWQPNHIRFTDINFQRVNLKDYWLIKKPGRLLKKLLVIATLIVIGLLSIHAVNMSKTLIIALVVVAVLGVIWMEFKDDKKGGRNSGCGGSGCSGGNHHGHSGCSGCSGSGCSGCGGGD